MFNQVAGVALVLIASGVMGCLVAMTLGRRHAHPDLVVAGGIGAAAVFAAFILMLRWFS